MSIQLHGKEVSTFLKEVCMLAFQRHLSSSPYDWIKFHVGLSIECQQSK